MKRSDVSNVDVCAAYAIARQLNCFPTAVLLAEFSDFNKEYKEGKLRLLEIEKVCYRAMERAESHGLIDYGVSLRSGWLTNKGILLLWKNYPVSLFTLYDLFPWVKPNMKLEFKNLLDDFLSS